MDDLLTTSELCEWLKVTHGTAWKWRKKGMPFIGSGKGIRYRISEIEQWLEEQARKSKN